MISTIAWEKWKEKNTPMQFDSLKKYPGTFKKLSL